MSLCGLEFDQEAIFDEDVGSKGVSNQGSTMLDWHLKLTFQLKASLFQLGAEQKLVSGLQQAGAISTVKMIAAIDDLSCNLFKAVGIETSWLRDFVRARIEHRRPRFTCRWAGDDPACPT